MKLLVSGRFVHAMAGFAISWSAVVSGPAAAEPPYPNRPVRIIAPYGAGGSYDVIARIMGQKLAEQMGQQFVVDNRPGATGRIGMELGTKSAPDGYTMFVIGSSQTIAPSVYLSVPYDLRTSVQPIMMFATISNAAVIYPTIPAQNLQEFINLAKAAPGSMRFGSGGTGGITHLAGELFATMAGVKMDHVPYKAGALATNAILANEIQFYILNLLNALPHVEAKRLRALAVTGLKRSAFAPSLPTLNELGLTGYDVIEFHSMAFPPGTSKELVGRMHGEFTRALKTEDTVRRFAQLAAEITFTSPQDTGAYLLSEQAKYGKIVKAIGLKPE
jgi:tripartite-type tricarboxylate transporter receptor subunit TctC